MGHGDRFLVPYLLFKKSIVWDKEPVPVSHPCVFFQLISFMWRLSASRKLLRRPRLTWIRSPLTFTSVPW